MLQKSACDEDALKRKVRRTASIICWRWNSNNLFGML